MWEENEWKDGQSYASCLEESEENNKFFIHYLVLTMWMYYICSSTVQFYLSKNV